MFAPLVLAVDFMNFTYHANPCAKNVPVPVVMRRGRFSYEDRRMAAGFDLFIRGVTRGSLKPGTRQAVVVMTCDFPIGGVAAAYAFDERGMRAVPLGEVAEASWGGDWGAGPDSMKFRFAGRSLYVSQCGDLHCRSRQETTYVLRGARLVKIFDRTYAIHDAWYYSDLASRYAREHKVKLAIANYTRAIQLEPREPFVYTNRANFYLETNDYAHALADLTSAIRVDPKSPGHYVQRGDAYANHGDFAHAIADYTSALARDKALERNGPNDEYAGHRYIRGKAYLAKHDYDRAIADFTEAIRIDQLSFEKDHVDASSADRRDPQYFAARADAYRYKKDYARAIEDYTTAARLYQARPPTETTGKSEFARVLDGRAEAYYSTHQTDAAIADASAAVKLAPGDPSAWLSRGMVYFGQKDYDRALSDLTQTIRLAGRAPEPFYIRGLVYEAKGEYERAIADFTAGLRASPNDAAALNARCWDRAILGRDLQAALVDCNEALRLRPAAPRILDSRGFVYFKLGRFQRAIDDFDAALKLDPKLAGSLYLRGLAKRRIGDSAGGDADVAAAKALAPDIDARYARYGVTAP